MLKTNFESADGLGISVTFNLDKQDVTNFAKFSKMTMCKFKKVVIDPLALSKKIIKVCFFISKLKET